LKKVNAVTVQFEEAGLGGIFKSLQTWEFKVHADENC